MGDHVEAGSKRYRIVEEHEPGGPKCVEHMAPEANDADQIATLPIDRIPIVALQVVFIGLREREGRAYAVANHGPVARFAVMEKSSGMVSGSSDGGWLRASWIRECRHGCDSGRADRMSDRTWACSDPPEKTFRLLPTR